MNFLNRATCGMSDWSLRNMFWFSNNVLYYLSYPLSVARSPSIAQFEASEHFLLLPEKSKKLLFMDDKLLCFIAILLFHKLDTTIRFCYMEIESHHKFNKSYYIPLKVSTSFIESLLKDTPEKKSKLRYFAPYLYENFYVIPEWKLLEIIESVLKEYKIEVTVLDVVKVFSDSNSLKKHAQDLQVDHVFAFKNLRNLLDIPKHEARPILNELCAYGSCVFQTLYIVDIAVAQFDTKYLKSIETENIGLNYADQFDYDELINSDQYIVRVIVLPSANATARQKLQDFLEKAPYRSDLFINQLPVELIDYINLIFSTRTSLPDAAKSKLMEEQKNLIYFKKAIYPTVTIYARYSMIPSIIENTGDHITVVHDGRGYGKSIVQYDQFLKDITDQHDRYAKSARVFY